MFGRNDDFDDMFNELSKMFGGFPRYGKLNLRGDKNVEKGKDENGEWTKETFTSEDGGMVITSFVRRTPIGGGDFMNLFNEPKKKYTGAEGLKKELKVAIENEDYELAIKLRDMIKEREANQETIDQLEKELKEVIEQSNFERAIEIREELKKLKK
jgi:excinuclease UvrABC nuclease subunit